MLGVAEGEREADGDDEDSGGGVRIVGGSVSVSCLEAVVLFLCGRIEEVLTCSSPFSAFA